MSAVGDQMDSTIEVLRNALQEIKLLRGQNEILAAKVEVMELFTVALRVNRPPDQQQAMRVDPVWVIEKQLSELERLRNVTNRLAGKQTAEQAPGTAFADMAAAQIKASAPSGADFAALQAEAWSKVAQASAQYVDPGVPVAVPVDAEYPF